MKQSQQNFFDDLRGMGEDYVRQFLQSDLEDQDLLDELVEYIENGGEINFR